MAIVAEAKVCSKCRLEKTVAEFHIDRSQKDNRKSACRSCTNQVKRRWRHDNANLVRQRRREEWSRNKATYDKWNKSDRRRQVILKHKCEKQYGITVEQFEQMLEANDGRCYICDKLPEEIPGHKHKRLGIDHDHKTGKVRGVLCTHCNAMLGSARDNIAILKRAIIYLHQLFPNPTAKR